MNKKALGLAGLGAVALVGGSLAYYSHEATLDNPFTTGSFETHLEEDYTPPTDDLIPGTKWEKKVGAENTGDYPVLVRIKMSEVWTRKPIKLADDSDKYKGDVAGEYKRLDSTTNAFTTGTFDLDTKEFIANQPGDTPKEPDGMTKEDHTTVYKNLPHTTDNASDDAKWYFNAADGYWYWTDILEPGDPTDPLMDYLVLATNLDTGVYNKKEQYQINKKNATDGDLANGEWIEVNMAAEQDLNTDGKTDIIDLATRLEREGKLDNNQTLYRKSDSTIDTTKPGYADSNYTLNVKAEFVQATSDAVKASWGVDNITNILPGVVGNSEDNVLVNQ